MNVSANPPSARTRSLQAEGILGPKNFKMDEKKERHFTYENKAARGTSLLKYDIQFLNNDPSFFTFFTKKKINQKKECKRKKRGSLKALFSGRKPRTHWDRVKCLLLKRGETDCLNKSNMPT